MYVLDLFCGAGGLSIGLEEGGLEVLAGVDKDADAIETFSHVHPKALSLNEDVLDAIDALRGVAAARSRPLVLAGGPPCQGFCSINPNRHVDDPRNSGIDAYLHIVKELRPDFVLIENVTGLLSLGGGFARKKLEGTLSSLGYQVSLKVLQAAHYGAPQSRWRLIIAASRFGRFDFPEPEYHADVKPNVAGGRELTFSTRAEGDLLGKLPPAMTVWDAISDLPPLLNGGGVSECRYTRQARSELQCRLREGAKSLLNHQAQRLVGVNLERIKRIPEGGNWQSLPADLVPANIKNSAEKWGRYTPTRFGRLRKDGLFTTMLTKPEPYWGSFIHPVDDRLISVREAARAQTFPDRVRFTGPLASQYRQVGNAVPAVIGRALGRSIVAHLESAVGRLLSPA